MARVTRYIDDLTGKEIEEGKGGPVTFSIRGEYYELDLSEESAAKLDKALAPFIDKATKVAAPHAAVSPKLAKVTTRMKVSGQGREYLDSVRRWARDNGRQVADRGRVAADIIAAYEAAKS